MNVQNMCYQAALNYHKYRNACKPSEHCYFKGKYKAYSELIMNECGVMSLEVVNRGVYKVTTNTGFYWYGFE